MRRLFLFILLIAAVYFAKPYWEESVSQYVDISFLQPIDEKVDSFLEDDSVTSAVRYINNTADKAVLFFSSKTDDVSELMKDVEKPKLEKPSNSSLSIYNIEIGTSKDTITAKLGEPNAQTMNEYGTEWHTYHEGYSNFLMISYDKAEKVNAIYTNDDLISTAAGIEYGSTKSFVREKFGEPIKEIRKGINVYVLQDTEGFDLFEVDGMYVYAFYDLHKDDTLTALKIVEKSLEQEKTGRYADGDDSLRDGFERQLFDLTNAARVRNGLKALELDKPASGTARKHSLDMAQNSFFSHDNLQGESFDRMEKDGVSFLNAGENLAYGQSSSIFAHEGLMNSPGHRENILLDVYSHLGTGVAFNDELQPFCTELFSLKR